MTRNDSGAACEDLGVDKPTQDDPVGHVRARIQNLRARLLGSSRQHPLIQFTFRQISSRLIRFVDEMLDALAQRPFRQKPVRMLALPPINQPLPDEIVYALEVARTTDGIYIEASSARH
ncbi:hypothetical protein [Tropicimonas sp. IMCC34011]|uniref:hypothetical protein n=1 Tax=Tropicimonas sp. IMCC34011 TaxID=2248759 RepID=UPI001300B3F2|nr:hypothetical protein [Tropicimonas sp. IMCC34011]